MNLTVLSDGCRRSLQHVLRKVDEGLVELSSPQQVEVFDNLLRSNSFTHSCHPWPEYEPESWRVAG